MNFRIRELVEGDLDNGFLETLDNLRAVGKLSNIQKRNIFKKIKLGPGNRIFVAIDEAGKVVGSTTLMIEQKFIHQGGLVGHIEDVVTHKDFRGMGVGRALVQHATDTARNAGCYKIILNCTEENREFYEKIGFKQHGIEMRIDLK